MSDPVKAIICILGALLIVLAALPVLAADKAEDCGDDVDCLISVLKSGQLPQKMHAARKLGELGDAKAIEPLMRATKSRDQMMSTVAVAALGQIGEPAKEQLLKLTGRRDANVRGAAVEALAAFNDAEVVDALLKTIRDDDRRVRGAAAVSLAKTGSDQAYTALESMLRDRSLYVRGQAAKGLGILGDARSAEPLVKMLNELDPQVASEVIFALVKLGPGVSSDPLLDHVLKGPTYIRARACTTLGLLKEPRAVGPMIQCLKSVDPHLVRAAIFGLAQIGDAKAINALEKVSVRLEEVDGKSLGQWAQEAIHQIEAANPEK